MKCLLLSVVLPCVAASMCLRFLKNERETEILEQKSGYVWRWNAITAEFENLEALRLNNSAFCSVDTVNDLRGRTLVVGADLTLPPYVIINASTNEVTGFIGDVWKTLEGALQFKTIYRRIKWTAMRGLPDTGIDALLITTAMYVHPSTYLRYSSPFSTVWYSLFVQSDGAIITTWWYINIFSYGVWTASFVSVVCTACCIIGVHHVKRLVCDNKRDCNDELSSPLLNILFVVGGMTGQGLQRIPKDLSMRIIMLSLLTMGMLLSYGFSSTLTSCLASKGNVVPLDDLEDIAVKRTHTLCVRNNSGAYVYFLVEEEAIDSELQDKWKGLVNNDCPDMMNKADIISRICRPGFVYLEVPGIFLPVYRKVNRTCELLQLPDTYWKRKISFVHSRTALHWRLIDSYLMRMRSAGILTYLEKKWVLEEFNTVAEHIQSNTFQPVEYMHIHLTICSLVLMMFVSIIICVLENVCYKLQEKRKNSNLRLPRMRNGKWNRAKTSRYQARPRLKHRRKLNAVLLLDTKNAEFSQTVMVRLNQWQTSRSRW